MGVVVVLQMNLACYSNILTSPCKKYHIYKYVYTQNCTKVLHLLIWWWYNEHVYIFSNSHFCNSLFIKYFVILDHFCATILGLSFSTFLSFVSCVPGAGLFDFPKWLGCRGHPGYVRRGDRKVHAGKLFCSLGLHTGHHRHPRCSHPILSCFCPRKPPERLYARWNQGWK